MASFFTLEIDTMAPEIEVFVPKYVLSSGDLDIVVQSNEELDPSYQEFYLIDSKGGQHSFILTYSNKQFKGKVSLFNIPIGLLTVHIGVKDSVLNPSAIVTETLTVINGARVKINSQIRARLMEMDIKVRPVLSTVKTRFISTRTKTRSVVFKEKTRPIKTEVK